MKKLLRIVFVLFTTATFAQAGHIMQGVGAVNMSMGGAGTALSLDTNSALLWNPAGLSKFNGKILSFDIGAFSSSPELSSSLSAGMMWEGSPAVAGTTEDERGSSPMPAISYVWGKEDSRSTFGVSAFGISGFGVTFPEEVNTPLNPNFNPMENSNPINYPQNLRGFGHIESNYMLMQISFAWSYEIMEGFSFGVQPNFNYASLELAPNPLATPGMPSGYPEYPVSNNASATGFGAQFGLHYVTEGGFSAGLSYKTAQAFGEFDFENTYSSDNSSASNVKFRMDYPAILSLGLGYSADAFDITVDYRNVNYENTDGFSEKGWTETGSVKGFGWNNINVISAGLQLKMVEKLPIRLGYTYSSNPIEEELAFFSVPATAVIKNAFQIGLGYEFSDKFVLNGVYHYGTSGGDTSGKLLNPEMISPNNPYGAMEGSSVSYSMDTSMIMLGISYNFAK